MGAVAIGTLCGFSAATGINLTRLVKNNHLRRYARSLVTAITIGAVLGFSAQAKGFLLAFLYLNHKWFILPS